MDLSKNTSLPNHADGRLFLRRQRHVPCRSAAEHFVEPVEKVIIYPQNPCIASGNLL
jgi:hypothetical protein